MANLYQTYRHESKAICHQSYGYLCLGSAFAVIERLSSASVFKIKSMSRKGNCWDNAVAESFFGSIKSELVYRKTFETQNEAKESIFEYIEIFYNRQRLHSALDYLTPEDLPLKVRKRLRALLHNPVSTKKGAGLFQSLECAEQLSYLCSVILQFTNEAAQFFDPGLKKESY